MVDYQLIRSPRRKSIALQIRLGKVIVRAPHCVDQQVIDDLVQKKHAWISEKLEASLKQSSVSSEDTLLADGGRIWLAGKQRNIKIAYATRESIAVNEEQVIVTLANRYHLVPADKLTAVLKRRFEQWMKQNAKTLLEQKVHSYAKLTKLHPNSLNVRLYRARWGSCNNRGELSFNFLLMMVPDWVVDYVVVHELCHLQHLNHSREFWQLVERHYPDFSAAKRWLKQHQYQLTWPK